MRRTSLRCVLCTILAARWPTHIPRQLARGSHRSCCPFSSRRTERALFLVSRSPLVILETLGIRGEHAYW